MGSCTVKELTVSITVFSFWSSRPAQADRRSPLTLPPQCLTFNHRLITLFCQRPPKSNRVGSCLCDVCWCYWLTAQGFKLASVCPGYFGVLFHGNNHDWPPLPLHYPPKRPSRYQFVEHWIHFLPWPWSVGPAWTEGLVGPRTLSSCLTALSTKDRRQNLNLCLNSVKIKWFW